MADLSKDEAVYPEFTPEVVGDLRTSLDLLLEDVVWSESSDFRELLRSYDPEGKFRNPFLDTYIF